MNIVDIEWKSLRHKNGNEGALPTSIGEVDLHNCTDLDKITFKDGDLSIDFATNIHSDLTLKPYSRVVFYFSKLIFMSEKIGDSSLPADTDRELIDLELEKTQQVVKLGFTFNSGRVLKVEAGGVAIHLI